MEILSSIPIPAVAILIALIIIILALFFFLRKKKNASANPDNPTVIGTDQISTTPAKSNDGKYIIVIIAASLIAISIPFVVMSLVSQQTGTKSQTSSSSSSLCRAITITDTLNTPLTQEALSVLRPGDEVKILIATTGEKIEKARFRVNGSQWQEVTIKNGDNFVGNYILDSGIKKFTVEAEVYDKEKGWL